MARIIAVSNQKGGVGKTTTAVNLAACLAVAEKKTLLVDLDPQANAGSGMGVCKHDFDESIYDVLVDEKPIKNAILRTNLAYLDLLPSCQDLIGAEIELVSALGREVRLSDALSTIASFYDYIILDCPPALGLLTVNALTAAETVLVPVQCEYYAMEGLAQLLHTITLIQKRLNPQLAIEGLLLTMHDKRNNICQQVEKEIRGHFGPQVFDVVIPRNVKLSEAPSHGKPIVLYDITSSGAGAYIELARLLIKRHSDTETPRETWLPQPGKPGRGHGKQLGG